MARQCHARTTVYIHKIINMAKLSLALLRVIFFGLEVPGVARVYKIHETHCNGRMASPCQRSLFKNLWKCARMQARLHHATHGCI